MARSVSAMEALYRRYGLERDPMFRDLADHLSLNLQWLAWVYSETMEAREAEIAAITALTDAATMLHDFTLPVLAGVRRKFVKADMDTTTHYWQLLAGPRDPRRYDADAGRAKGQVLTEGGGPHRTRSHAGRQPPDGRQDVDLGVPYPGGPPRTAATPRGAGLPADSLGRSRAMTSFTGLVCLKHNSNVSWQHRI